MTWLRFDPATANDLFTALRLLEGRLAGSGRRLTPGARDLMVAAERSLAARNGHPVADSTVVPHDGRVELLTYREAAQRLRLSERSVRRRVRDGALPAVTIGRARRVRPADLEGFIDGLPVGEEEGAAW